MTASSVNVCSDPQGSIAYLLRPPTGYLTWYQGQAATTPIALVAADEYQQYSSIERGAPRDPDMDPYFQRYLTVPRDSKLRIWFPRFVTSGNIGVPSITQTYQYALHWRLRTAKDGTRTAQPWSLLTRIGAPDWRNVSPPNFTPDRRIAIPSARGPIITPNLNEAFDPRPLVAAGTYGTLSNGIRNPASYYPTDLSLGDTYYQPETVTCFGDELLITVTRVDTTLGSGLWDFNTLTVDQSFAQFFGDPSTGVEYPGLGIYLYSTTSTND